MFKRILAMTLSVLLIAAPCWGSVEVQDDGTVVGIANSIDFVGSTTTVSNSVATVTLNDIDSGTIDGAVIGGTTPAAGTFTTLEAETSLTLDGVTITSFGGVVSPWTDGGASTTLNSAPAGFVCTHGTGSFKATQLECGSGDLLFENAQLIDGGTNGYIKFIEAGDTFMMYMDATDIQFLASNGGIIFDLNQADGDIEMRLRNDDNDYFHFYTAANIPTIATAAAGDGDIAIIPGGGDVLITGNLDVSGTITGTIAFTTVTMGDDTLSRPADDILRWTSNDEHATIESYGFTGKDGRLLLTSNASAVAGDEWLIEADGGGSQNLIIHSDISGAHAAIWQMSTAGDITMEGDVITLGDDEYITNAVDGTVRVATNTEDAILQVYSAKAADGDATLSLVGDAAGAVNGRWDIISDTGADTLIFKSDPAVVGTMVTKLTIDSADGDILTTGDVAIIEDMDLIIGAAAGTDYKVQFDDGVDDQLLIMTALVQAIDPGDPMVQILLDTGNADGTGMTADQDVFAVSKGTQASNVDLFQIDEDGDAIINSSLDIIGAGGLILSEDETVTQTGDGVVRLTGDDTYLHLEVFAVNGAAGTEDAVLILSADGSTDAGDTWSIESEATGNELTFNNEATEIVSISKTADISSASATASKPVLWLENTADDATAPSIILENDRGSEADDDDCGTIIFRASDTGDATFDAVTILCEATDVTPTDEAGKITIDVEVDDVATEMLSMYGTAGGATGGIYFNQDEADIDFIVSGNTTAGYLTIDATVESTTLTSSVTLMPSLIMLNTTDDATGPTLELQSDRASFADDDVAGRIIFEASDAAGTQNDVVTIIGYIEEVTDADEAGTLEIKVMHDDGTPALDSFVVLSGDNGTPGQGEIVFNEDSKDINFSIETDGTDDFVFVDAGSDFVALGGATAAYVGDNYAEVATTPSFQVNTSADDGGIAINTWSTTETEGGALIFNTADHATIGNYTVLQAARDIGGIYWNAADSNSFECAAAILVETADLTADGDTPGEMVFYTSPDASDTPTERMRINEVGLVTIAGDAVVSGGDLTMASATASKPVLWLENTTDDGTCPIIQLENDEATPADGDDIGIIKFINSDSGGVTADYVTILAEANEINATDDAGKLTISARINDVDTTFIDMFGDTTGATTGHININTGAADIDFHIDGDNQADLFLIDAGTDTIDMDLAQTTSRLLITTGAAGTATESLIWIDDNRTGVTADTKEEATLEIDPEGTHAIHVVDGISHFGGTCNFAGGQTRKVWFGIGGVAADTCGSSIVLDSANAPGEGVYGTAGQSEYAILKFDANPNTTGDDYVHITWKVPDGYMDNTAVLNIHFVGPAGEVAGDDIVFDGTIRAVASGEGLDAGGTGLVAVTDEQTTAVGGEHFMATLDLEVLEIDEDDMVNIAFFVDEDSCELAVAGTCDIFGFEIEYESSE